MVVEGGIVVTESSRGKLWRLLCFLGWSEAVVGAVLAVVVYRPTAALSAYLPSSHNSLLHVFYAELMVGLTSSVVAVQGVLVSQASLHNPLLKSTARAYKTWLILGISLVFSLTVALIVIPTAVEAGQNEILEIMKGGVSFYLSSIEWKTSLDKMHQRFQCCGVSSISDWYTSRWIPIRSFRPEVADLQDVLGEDGTLGARVVPASCCNPAVRLPCFHDTLQQNSSPADPRTVLHPETVFTRGCGPLVVNPAASTVGPFKVLAITIILLQTGQLVIGRYLYTGARSVAKSVENENERCCRTRSRTGFSPTRMICAGNCSSDTCATSPTSCSAERRPRSRKFNIFSRKRTTTASDGSFPKSNVRKLGEVIKSVSRSMLCGLSGRSPRGSVKSSSGKGKSRTDGGRALPQTVKLLSKRKKQELPIAGTPERLSGTTELGLPDSPLTVMTGMTEAPQNRSSLGTSQQRQSNLLNVYPVTVKTDVSAALLGDSCDSGARPQKSTTRFVCIKPAKVVKSKVHQEIRSSNAPAEIRAKLLESTRKPETYHAENDFDLLNLHL